jgi:hypothetical protein
LVESFENSLSRRKALKRSHFSCSEFSAMIHKRIERFTKKVRLKRIFIQEDRDRAIASGLMKNTNLSLVLLKQKKR